MRRSDIHNQNARYTKISIEKSESRHCFLFAADFSRCFLSPFQFHSSPATPQAGTPDQDGLAAGLRVGVRRGTGRWKSAITARWQTRIVCPSRTISVIVVARN